MVSSPVKSGLMVLAVEQDACLIRRECILIIIEFLPLFSAKATTGTHSHALMADARYSSDNKRLTCHIFCAVDRLKDPSEKYK